jgi:four helix bundle protein
MSTFAMTDYQKKLKQKMSVYAHACYRVSRLFPREELYSSVSQLRRAAMSVILNYIEGFARIREKVKLNSFETSYGSLQESLFVLEFALEEKWIKQEQYSFCADLGDEIGAMLWTEIKHLKEEK